MKGKTKTRKYFECARGGELKLNTASTSGEKEAPAYEHERGEKRIAVYASHGRMMLGEFMAPTGKSGFRMKNAAETRMIARFAFNHARKRERIFLPKAD